MGRRKLVASFIVCLSLAMPLAFGQQFSTVEERMSSTDFKAAGLDKLSPEELARLNAFIRNEVDRRTAQAHEAGIREQDRNDATKIGFRDYHGDRGEIVSGIVGEFHGWDGGTRFTLENGQVWRQIEPDRFVIRKDHAVAHISPGMMGTWFLKIEGYGSSTKVERVQ